MVNKEFFEALEFYEKCLRITRKATTLDNLAVIVNKIACLLSLEKYTQVVSECNDAMRLIKNYSNKAQDKISPDETKRIKAMQLKVIVRKATA